MDKLNAKVEQIESSKPALEALLKGILELESKLSEDRKYEEIDFQKQYLITR